MIEHHLERISLLQHYEDQYNWNRLEFLLAIQKISRRTLQQTCYLTPRRVYTQVDTKFNVKCNKQANVMMIGDQENRHYTSIKNLPCQSQNAF